MPSIMSSCCSSAMSRNKAWVVSLSLIDCGEEGEVRRGEERGGVWERFTESVVRRGRGGGHYLLNRIPELLHFVPPLTLLFSH